MNVSDFEVVKDAASCLLPERLWTVGGRAVHTCKELLACLLGAGGGWGGTCGMV